MRIIRFFGALVLAGAALGAFASAEEAASSWVVSAAEGSVEIRRGADDPALAETGADVAPDDRVHLGCGASLSAIQVEGPSPGRVVLLQGPADGTFTELLAAASASASAGSDLAAALGSASTENLGAAEVHRGSGGGPLRAVYPAGKVAAPCADFVFVPDVDDLGDGRIEVRLFDRDPASSGGATPVATCAAEGPCADVAGTFAGFEAGKKFWWQAVVRSGDEDVLAGEPAEFTLVKAPAGADLPPKGLDTPEQAAAWRLLRAKSFVKAQLYLDAYREYLALTAAGGGGATLDRECRNLEKKLGLDEGAVRSLTDGADRPETSGDGLVLTDGRTYTGRLVSSDAEAVLFQVNGTRYRFPAGWVREVKKSTSPPLPSAAKFVTVTSKHYIVSTNAGKEYGKEAARQLEALFETFSKSFGDVLGAHNAKNLKAVIYRDDTDFAAFLAGSYPDQTGGQGFFCPRSSTLYLFRSFDGGIERTCQTLYHEGVHQLLFVRCNTNPSVAVAANYWISEAFPCYFEGMELRDGVATIERPAESRVEGFMRMSADGKLLPLPEFVALRHAQYKSAEVYTQGTAVFWYMMRRNGGKDARRFLEFVKDVISGRTIVDSDRKLLGAPIAKAAEGYEEWFKEAFGPKPGR